MSKEVEIKYWVKDRGDYYAAGFPDQASAEWHLDGLLAKSVRKDFAIFPVGELPVFESPPPSMPLSSIDKNMIPAPVGKSTRE